MIFPIEVCEKEMDIVSSATLNHPPEGKQSSRCQTKPET